MAFGKYQQFPNTYLNFPKQTNRGCNCPLSKRTIAHAAKRKIMFKLFFAYLKNLGASSVK